MSEKTMGQLFNLIRKLEMPDNDIEVKFSSALKKRNWLAHPFFVEHAIDFMSENGRNNMIKELNCSIDIFNSAEDILNPISRNASLKYGLTDEILDKIINEMYECGKSDR